MKHSIKFYSEKKYTLSADKRSIVFIDVMNDFNREWLIKSNNSREKEKDDFTASNLKNSFTKIKQLFSVVIQFEGKSIIASDIIRSRPIFYGFTNNKLFITDSVKEFQSEYGKFEIDDNNLEQYIASGFVYGNGTIYKDVYAVQPGEIITVEDKKIKSERYFEYKPIEPFIDTKIEKFSKRFDEVLLKVFSKMFEQAPYVNNWVVPLSGGHDSRLIINYLYKLGQKNVICFSYGTKNSIQAHISKQTADAVGYPWFFVEYKEEKWGKLFNSGIIDKYIDYAFNGVSTPHLQDFLAVFELKEKNIIKENDVFLPGHSLDFIAGSHLNHEDFICNSRRSAIKRVYKKFVRNNNIINDDIISSITSIFDSALIEPENFQEYFNWQERQAKFICNSIRVYDFFGFESRLPFWDKVLVEFWLNIKPEERAGRKLFFKAEKNGLLIPELLDIPFANDSINKNKSRNSYKQHIKQLIPKSIANLMLRTTKRKLKLDEGMNLIFSLKGKYVNDIIGPLKDFPLNTHKYFKDYLFRYPFQLDYHFLTTLYTVRKELNKHRIE